MCSNVKPGIEGIEWVKGEGGTKLGTGKVQDHRRWQARSQVRVGGGVLFGRKWTFKRAFGKKWTF